MVSSALLTIATLKFSERIINTEYGKTVHVGFCSMKLHNSGIIVHICAKKTKHLRGI